MFGTVSKKKLNQRYEHLIEQREELNKKYDELNKRYKGRLDQDERINQEKDINVKRARDLLNSLSDLRNDLYFQNAKENATQ
ncbi:hypothetical protein PAV_13c01450 [Paenibacillus alvei DSM 29]|nr:hypothetical protein PAV_13c01450 [Paenibacillus alvei DSM 29]